MSSITTISSKGRSMLKLYFENIEVDRPHRISDFVSIHASDDEKYLGMLKVSADEHFVFETNIPLWLQTFKLALPMLHIKAYSKEFKYVSELAGTMINYYSADQDPKYSICTKHTINPEDIAHITKVNRIITAENRAIHEQNKEMVNPWTIAYQLYQAASASHDLFQSILSLAATLETLLQEKAKALGTGVATYGSRLYSDDAMHRVKAFETIESMLVLRDSVLSGNMSEAKLKLSDDGFLERYFLFKKVCADILIGGYDEGDWL